MTTFAEKTAVKNTADFADFLRSSGHEISIVEDFPPGYTPVIEIHHPEEVGGFSLHPKDDSDFKHYNWEFMHYKSGTIIRSGLNENSSMDKIYEFFGECVEKSKTL